MAQEMKRRFSLESDFMNYSVNDLIYGYLSYKSTFDSESKERYIYVKTVSSLKSTMAAMIQKTPRTVTNNINAMIDRGLLMLIEKDGQSAYLLTEGIGRYQLVNYDILWYLLQTRSKIAIKVYVYLLNKYLWKQQTHENYIFTIDELSIAMGYAASSTTVQPMVSVLLDSFAREGLLKWREVVDTKEINGKMVPVTRRELISIIERKEQWPQVTVERVYANNQWKF